ncbi:MAG: transposase [Candidatus Aminicenantes bacterium]|nr:transposase [Candidatus Aminicenantes bacterium]
MKKKIEYLGRRSLRLKGWDYSSPHYYFITICTKDRQCLFGEITNSIITLNTAGEMLNEEWRNIPSRFDFLELDEYIIMPNHVHAILHIICRGEPCVRPEPCIHPRSLDDHIEEGEHEVRPYGTESGSLGRIIQAYKSITTHNYIQQMKNFHWPEFQKRLWQRNFFEHIVRSERELWQIRQYIFGNPANWSNDHENPSIITFP